MCFVQSGGSRRPRLAMRLVSPVRRSTPSRPASTDPSLPLAFKIAALFSQRIEEIFEPDAEPPTTGGSGDRMKDVIERAS